MRCAGWSVDSPRSRSLQGCGGRRHLTAQRLRARRNNAFKRWTEASTRSRTASGKWHETRGTLTTSSAWAAAIPRRCLLGSETTPIGFRIEVNCAEPLESSWTDRATASTAPFCSRRCSKKQGTPPGWCTASCRESKPLFFFLSLSQIGQSLLHLGSHRKQH